MTIPAPFGGDFPLNQDPYNSRLQTQIEAAKNYFMVAFKPGFPLQAAELNEIQEIFYVQQTLTQTMFSSWHTKNYLEQNGVEMLATPWNGCTPLSPDLITSNISASGKIGITAAAGWYLAKQINPNENTNGGFGVWVHNPSDATLLSNYDATSTSKDGEYGMIVEQVSINCTTNNPAGTNEDRDLQDSSNLSAVNGPCGAARLKAKVVKFGKDGDEGLNQTFLPIITASSNPSPALAKVIFKNNYTIAQVP